MGAAAAVDYGVWSILWSMEHDVEHTAVEYGV